MRPARSTLATLGAVLVLAAGCGADSAPREPEPSTPISSSDPGSPTTSPSATVKPASGDLVETSQYSVRLPRGFEAAEEVASIITADEYGTRDLITFAALDGYGDTPLDVLVGKEAGDGLWEGRPDRRPDVTVDGETVYHLAGPYGGGIDKDLFGAVVDGGYAYVSFTLYGSRGYRERLVESVLASWQWK